jgi:serine/threonine-protein kinase
MATVHVGRLNGPVGFSRTVAIKRLHPQFAADPEFAGMFLDEARLAGRIRHPNAVPVIDVVEAEGEILLVMEYVQGETLARLIRKSGETGERMPPEVASAIVHDTLEGLHAVHEARDERGQPLGIVHRDVSPQNVIVGVDGVARVLDFGIAKAAGRAQVTREGQLKGKLSYMAPEQLQGSVTRSTDIFAAGIVLWEALTGKRLFLGSNEGETIARILHGEVAPPSSAGAPPELDAVVMKALAKKPEERYATAREMAVALAKVRAPADPHVVGAWVERTAKEVLDARAELISSVETAPSLPNATAPASTPALEPVVDGTQAELSRDAVERARRRPVWVLPTIGLVLVALTVSVTLAATGAFSAKPAPSAATATSAPIATETAQPTALPSALPTGVASASAAASASTPVRPTATARLVPTVRPTATTKPTIPDHL